MTQTVFDRNPTLAKPTGRTAWAESFEPKLEELRDSLRTRRPQMVAERAGVNWQPESRTLVLRHLDRGYRLGWPELVAHDVETGQPCGAELQGLFLYYLERANGAPAGRFQITAQATGRPAVDPNTLAEALRGQKAGETAQYLNAMLPLAEPPALTVRPSWWWSWFGRLPLRAEQIEVVIRP